MSDYFNLSGMQESLSASICNECSDTDVKLQEYLDSYQHINMFFSLMGTIFSFVSKDLQAKMDILRGYVNDGHYTTVRTMFEYERDKGLLEKRGYVSGARTLLRLHRGLDFIRAFLKRILGLRDEDGTAQACREAYDVTLAPHHTFVIRKGAQLAMYALPTKENLFIKVCCGDNELIENSLQLLPTTLDTMATVYDKIDALFTKYDLHHLP